MRKSKKLTFILLLLMLVCVVAACFCACNEKDDNSGNNQGGNNETPTHTHTLSFVPAKSADCVISGNTAYYTCTCGKWFTDSNATTEITDKSSVVIGALGHKYSTEWSQSKTQHWHECTACGDKKDLTNHTAGTAATETMAQVCTVCDYVLTEPLGHTHNSVLVPAKVADCEVDGNIEYYTCTCGKWFSDSNATTEITDKSSVVLTATGHSYSSEWSYNSTQHWHTATCKHTNEKCDLQNHDFQNEVCSVCKYSVGLLTFNTLQLGENDTAYGKVSNDTTAFSFLKEVTTNNGATYTVCTDMACTQTVPSKTVSLQIGDNIFYILTERGNDLTLFTVTIRRRPIHTVTFQTSGTAVSSQSVEEDSFAVQPDETTKIGYTFDNWTYGGEVVSFPYTVTESITFTAEFTANKYTATLDVNGGDTLEKSEFSATYDELFSFDITPTRTGYNFLGWYDEETKVTDKKWNYAEDKTFTAKWQVNSYKVTVNYDEYAHGSVTGGGNYDYESSVTATATTKAGYTFIGWYNGENLLDGNLSYTFAMPAENVTYTAKWCKVSTESNNTTAGTVNSLTETYIAGEEVELIATTKTGYTFIGWYNGEILLSNDLIYSIEMPSVNTDYTAKWCKVKLKYDCGTVAPNSAAFNDDIYKTGDIVNVNVTGTYLGYDWLGWYNGDTLLTTNLDYTIIMPNIDTTFTAKWQAKEEMQIFSFESTTATCKITSLKDKAIKKVTIPNYVTDIADDTFDDCNDLKITENGITYVDKWAISFDSYTFDYSTYELTFRNDTVGIASRAFYACWDIMSVTIPNSILSIGSEAFSGCANLKNIIIPDSVTTISESAFRSCEELISVTIGKGVTYIGNDAFYNCKELTRVTVGENVTYIGYWAFSGCMKLTEIYFDGTKAQWQAIKKMGNWNLSVGSYIVYCTDSTISKYEDEK